MPPPPADRMLHSFQEIGVSTPKPANDRRKRPCSYDKSGLAQSPSREECRIILNHLFPTQDIHSLLLLSREELISRLKPQDSGSALYTNSASPSSVISEHTLDDEYDLADLEQIPSPDIEWDEERRSRDPIPAEADDVNALSLSVDRQSSYLGAASIKAAILVMFKIAPNLRSSLVASINSTTNTHSGVIHPASPSNDCIKCCLPILWSSERQTLIDAYFGRVHILVPMLDEPSFRADYLMGQRCDSPWLSLLNMVLAMGSIAANKSDNHDHAHYYNAANRHLGFESFSSSHPQTLQALALMGGYYLHYINRPNMASAVLGAALRMACAMGLHKESVSSRNAQQGRRTWWSLFCMDTWASTTLGRPSMGRWDPSTTARPPEEFFDLNNPSAQSSILPLIANINFCKIATQIQDTLAESTLLRAEDREALDSQLATWYKNLPISFHSTRSASESSYIARCIMKWRYQNLRLVLYRPVLLKLARETSEGDSIMASLECQGALNKCRSIAKEAIRDIASEWAPREWVPHQILGWHGAWLMYQASMIPLISLFWEPSTTQISEWHSQIELALSTFDNMADWSLAARRSREVVTRLYEASKRKTPGNPSIHSIRTIHTGSLTSRPEEVSKPGPSEPFEDITPMAEGQEIWKLDSMLWGTLPDGYYASFDQIPTTDFDEMGR